MRFNKEIKSAQVQTDRSSSENLTASTSVQPDRRKEHGSVGIEGVGGTSLSVFIPYGEQCQWQPVRRSPRTLHPHPALDRLNLVHSVVELNQSIRLKGAQILQPILITTCGTIVTGYREWQAALREGREVVDCFECSISEDQALEYMLMHDQRRRAWNSFNRVCIALELKACFQARAFANQQAGGKYKGSANLPKAERIDVREKIGALANVSGRTVSNVELILQKAVPRIIEALQSGILSINGALQCCALPRSRQIEHFTEFHSARSCDKIIGEAVAGSAKPLAYNSAQAVFEAIQQHETREPGSVVWRIGTLRKTVILLGNDLLSQKGAAAELTKG